MSSTSKHNEFQVFTTFDSISVLGLLAFSIVIVISIVSHAMIDQRKDRAQKRTRQLASQILIGGYNSPTLADTEKDSLPGRKLASFQKLDLNPVGRIGMDPWGSPYFYRILVDAKDQIKVLVLSTGEDRTLNSSSDYFSADRSIADVQIQILGDDIATVQYGL